MLFSVGWAFALDKLFECRTDDASPPLARLRRQRSCCVAVLQRVLVGAKLHQAGSIGFRVWLVVPDPPLVRRGLGIAFRRILPLLLTPEGSDVEVVPSVPHLLVAAVVDEVGAKHAVAVADERVRAMPLIHAEVLVEAVRDGVPRNDCHPIRAFRRSISVCGAREANTSVVSRAFR